MRDPKVTGSGLDRKIRAGLGTPLLLEIERNLGYPVSSGNLKFNSSCKCERAGPYFGPAHSVTSRGRRGVSRPRFADHSR